MPALTQRKAKPKRLGRGVNIQCPRSPSLTRDACSPRQSSATFSRKFLTSPSVHFNLLQPGKFYFVVANIAHVKGHVILCCTKKPGDF